MLVKSTPVKNERGKIAYVLETATDITTKKNLQEELNRAAGNPGQTCEGFSENLIPGPTLTFFTTRK